MRKAGVNWQTLASGEGGTRIMENSRDERLDQGIAWST